MAKTRFLMLTMIVASLLTANSARALVDARVAPGAKIPLTFDAATYRAKMIASTNQCYNELVLSSLLPRVSGVPPAPGTTPVTSDSGQIYKSKVGTNLDWLETEHWNPGRTTEMKFLEWTTPTTSVERSLSIRAGAQGPYYSADESLMYATVKTDFESKQVEVTLTLPGYLPYLQAAAQVHKVCSPNEWGRNGCVTSTEPVSEMSLIVPTNFVVGEYWINSDTARKSQKRFEFADYADCLLYEWEK